mmetsp:Transcript_59234/g.163557  ORF Transcript_59234/g.163557 Transcript_59234/m.163557 type:complete len:229 (-) Transcript_59234:323-1009(-)
MNNADSAQSEFGVRGLGGNPPKLVRALVESSQMRFEKQHADTVNPQALPPRIDEDLQELRTSISFTSIQDVSRINASKAKVVIKDMVDTSKPTRTLHCRLDRLACECGVPKIHEKPCAHVLKACDLHHVDVRSLLHDTDKFTTYINQYDAAGEFEVPGSALLDNLEPDKTLLMPVAAPIKAGRPSKKRKAGIMQQIHDRLKAAAGKARGNAAGKAASKKRAPPGYSDK